MFPLDLTWVLWRDLDLGDPRRYPVQEAALTEGWTAVSQELEGLPGWKAQIKRTRMGRELLKPHKVALERKQLAWTCATLSGQA